MERAADRSENADLHESDNVAAEEGIGTVVRNLLSNGGSKQAYVGETSDTVSRMVAHFRNEAKATLTEAHLIYSDKFNKSATLDIESNLIRYLDGDGKYKLLNGNLGLSNHNYYQKHQVYQPMFSAIWESLRDGRQPAR